MSRVRQRLLLVLAVAALLSFASAHDQGDDDDTATPEVPAVEAVLAFEVEASQVDALTLFADAAGGREVEATFTVTLLACRPEISDLRGVNIYGHLGCIARSSGLSSNAAGLTASGTLVVTAERIVATANGEGAATPLGPIAAIPIGPLALGESYTTDPVSYRFPAEEPPASRTGAPGIFSFQLSGRLVGCAVSNGSACGNGGAAFQLNVVPADPTGVTGGSAFGGLAEDGERGTYAGVFRSISDGALELREPNLIEIVFPEQGDRFSGTFQFSWAFTSTPDVTFVTSGTIQGEALGRGLRGEFALDDPEASYLAIALGASGQFHATLIVDQQIQGRLEGAGIRLEFLAELSR